MGEKPKIDLGMTAFEELFKDANELTEPAYIYLAKNRHGAMGKDFVWWIPTKTLFYEHNEKDLQDPNSPFTRTVGGDVASPSYVFRRRQG